MRMRERIGGGFHFQQVSRMIILRLAPSNIRDNFKFGVEDRDKSATLSIGWPVVCEMSNEIVAAVLGNLTRISTRK